jgi:hypothetical protein
MTGYILPSCEQHDDFIPRCGEQEEDHLLWVAVNQALFDRFDDGGEVVVSEDNSGRALGNPGRFTPSPIIATTCRRD